MSKKQRKSSTAGQNRWEPALMACPFEDESWKVNVQFVVENDVLDEQHIQALASVVKIPQRRLFSHLTKSDLLNMVSELGNPKNKKPPKLPTFFEITEIVFGLLNAEQEIPLPLWAKLIKFGLLNIKDEAMKKKENELKSKDDKDKHGKGSGKKRARSKSPGKKGKKTPEPHLPKKDWSTLKKRGEEDDGDKYIDDEPDDGPQHYILISGFRKPQLLVILGELGVHVNGVVKIRSESYELLAKMSDEKVGAAGHDEEALTQLHLQREMEVKELALFWKLLPIILSKASPTSKLQDLGVHEYLVKDQLYPADWENQDNVIGYGTAVFEDVACKIYDSLDWERQYLNYLKNVNLLHVPVYGKPEKRAFESRTTPLPNNITSASGKRGEKSKATLEAPTSAVEDIVPPITPPAQASVDTRYYQDLMNCVPMESVSVNLVMHCLLEQIEATEQDKIPPTEREQPARTDGIHMALAECIADSLQGLSLTEEDEQILFSDFPQFKSKKDGMATKNSTPSGPVLLHFGDDMSVRTHHLKEIDGFYPKKAEMQLLKRLPSASLVNFASPPPYIANERAAHLHELHRYATTVGKSSGSGNVISGNDVDQALRLFEFESMSVSSVNAVGALRRPSISCDNAWDDPYTTAAKRATGEGNVAPKEDQEKGSAEAEQHESGKEANSFESYFDPKRRLDSYTYSETFKSPVLLQMLEEARHTYPCMDAYYSKRDNATLVMFHFPMSDEMKCSSCWSASLHSDVGFRNYLENVAGPIQEWTKLGERKYQAELIAKELEKVKQAQEAQASIEQVSTPPPTGKRPRSKSSRRGSPSRSSSKAGANDDGQHFSSPFIRAGSLKADNELQAKAKEEEDKLKRGREAKRSAEKLKGSKSAASKSSAKLESKTSSATGKRPKSGRRHSKLARSRSMSQERIVEKPSDVADQLKMPSLPFTGYDVGNNLIHADGKSSYLYPCDGGTLKVEKVNYKQGQASVKTTLYKDGHVFVLHILEPMDPDADAELHELLAPPQMPKKASDNAEKGDTEATEKDTLRPISTDLMSGKPDIDAHYHSLFTSWCATLCDGMTLSFSCNGPEGISTAAVKAKEVMSKVLNDIPPASSPTPLPPGAETPKKGGRKSPKNKSPRSKSPRAKSPKGGKKGKDAEKEMEAQRLEEQRLQEELERKLLETREAEELEKRRRRMPKFPQLFTSCPDGLSIRYEVDPTSPVENPETEEYDFKLMVRQNYRYKTAGKQETEKLRAKPAMEEVSRLLLADGRVIKIMKDGSTKILYGDGTVCQNAGSGPIITDQRVPITPHSLPSGASNQQQALTEDQRTATSAGSKKGSKGRRSSGKTNPETTATEPSVAGTVGGQAAAGLEVDASARLEAEQEKAGTWVTIYINGEVTLTKADGDVIAKDPLLCYSATDPVSGEIMYSREDKVIRVDRPDGSSVCDHTDGTRITRFFREDEGEDQEKVWFVRVECPGFATVTFNERDRSCTTLFGSGSTLMTHIDGTYQLSHWNGGRLDISNEGTVMYTPQPNNDLLIAALANTDGGMGEEEERIPPPPPDPVGSYLMRHNSRVCCEALDQEGNVFQVKTSGETSVITTSHLVNSEEGGGENESKFKKTDPMDHHPPRLFVVRNDGTGTELLRFKDVQDYISDAQLDPITAVIREPMPDDIKVLGITVMRPHFGNSGDAWVLRKEESDIIPKHLKSRDLKHIPPRELKKPGPGFGTSVGKGLAVGSAPTPLTTPPAPSCPTALELRQLVQHQPISKDFRQHLSTKVLEYGRAVCEQERQREALQVNEPRTAEEQMKARDLLRLVLEFDDEGTPRSPDMVAPAPSGGGNGQPSSSKTFPSEIPDVQNSEIVKMKYEAAVAPPPLPVVPPPREKLTEADWDRIHRSLEEDKELRKTLKKLKVPAYFESEQGKAWLLARAPDMKSAARQLSTDPRSDGSEARMYGAGQQDESGGRRTSSTSPRLQDMPNDGSSSHRESGAGLVSDTPSKVRPTNPTPAHASGKGTPTKVRPDNPTPISADAQQQQRNARPSNPTPSHASSGAFHKPEPVVSQLSQQQVQPSPIPENPTSAQRRESHLTPTQSNQTSNASHNSRYSMLPLETEPSDLILTRSLLYDVTGKPRKDRVRLPTSILSDKPGAVPNEKFNRVEDQVRRKVRTSSVAGGLLQNHPHAGERGFEVLPPEVVFGVLREGTTYCFVVRMRNIGVDLCRFKVKQPPPGTGLKVHYSPGPVAAGMETKLDLELYAIAVGVEGDSGVGTINHELEIVTETDIIHLPVTAIVLPAYNYDNRTDAMPTGEKAPGVKISSNRPPSRDSILRPHKVSSSD